MGGIILLEMLMSILAGCILVYDHIVVELFNSPGVKPRVWKGMIFKVLAKGKDCKDESIPPKPI